MVNVGVTMLVSGGIYTELEEGKAEGVDQSVTKNKENKISGPIGSLQAGDK
jgi:hypothetical protein